MRENQLMSVFCDGGVISRNPSELGGTWACVFLDARGEMSGLKSGIVLPSEAGLPAITNNYTELLAAVQAMEAMPDGWDGILYTDSHVTRCRICNRDPSFKGIPAALESRVWDARKRIGKFKVVLLDGHPTKEQILAGVGKRGNPCSKWNVMCDRECNRLAKEFQTAARKEIPEVAALL